MIGATNLNWNTLLGTLPNIYFFSSLDSFIGSGLGYSTALIGCVNLMFAIIHSDLDRFFIHLIVSFGDNIGVPESFGIYKKEMEYLHQSNLKFLKMFINNLEEVPCHYYANSQGIGNNTYQRLWIEYGHKWLEDVEMVELVIPIVSFKHETLSSAISL